MTQKQSWLPHNRISMHVMLLQILQYLSNITGYFFVFLLSNGWIKKFCDSRILFCGEIHTHFTAEHVFISNWNLYASIAYKFRIHFPWVRSIIVSVYKIRQVLPWNWIISIDYINHFVHREMNLKKRTEHIFGKTSTFIRCTIRFFRFNSRWTK